MSGSSARSLNLLRSDPLSIVVKLLKWSVKKSSSLQGYTGSSLYLAEELDHQVGVLILSISEKTILNAVADKWYLASVLGYLLMPIAIIAFIRVVYQGALKHNLNLISNSSYTGMFQTWTVTANHEIWWCSSELSWFSYSSTRLFTKKSVHRISLYQ